MAPIDKALDRLSIAATRLNEQTNDLNQVIESLERKLDAMHVGVSVWILTMSRQGPLLVQEGNGRTSTGWELGYTKLMGQPIGGLRPKATWRIAAKPVTRSWGYVDESELESYWEETVDTGPAVPLLQAPRVVRVEAAGKLEALVDALLERVEEFNASVDRARELVDSE